MYVESALLNYDALLGVRPLIGSGIVLTVQIDNSGCDQVQQASHVRRHVYKHVLEKSVMHAKRGAVIMTLKFILSEVIIVIRTTGLVFYRLDQFVILSSARDWPAVLRRVMQLAFGLLLNASWPDVQWCRIGVELVVAVKAICICPGSFIVCAWKNSIQRYFVSGTCESSD